MRYLSDPLEAFHATQMLNFQKTLTKTWLSFNPNIAGIEHLAEAYLFVSGQPIKKRFGISYFGKPLMLTTEIFRIVFLLAYQRLEFDQLPRTPDSTWLVHKSDLCPADENLTSRYIFRLRHEFQEQGIPLDQTERLLYNNGDGLYGLNLDGNSVLIDVEQLLRFDHPDISDKASRIAALMSNL